MTGLGQDAALIVGRDCLHDRWLDGLGLVIQEFPSLEVSAGIFKLEYFPGPYASVGALAPSDTCVKGMLDCSAQGLKPHNGPRHGYHGPRQQRGRPDVLVGSRRVQIGNQFRRCHMFLASMLFIGIAVGTVATSAGENLGDREEHQAFAACSRLRNPDTKATSALRNGASTRTCSMPRDYVAEKEEAGA
ncbi:hypothetical protein MTO96_006872 [Rhipicephalus appendiculatus]